MITFSFTVKVAPLATMIVHCAFSWKRIISSSVTSLAMVNVEPGFIFIAPLAGLFAGDVFL